VELGESLPFVAFRRNGQMVRERLLMWASPARSTAVRVAVDERASSRRRSHGHLDARHPANCATFGRAKRVTNSVISLQIRLSQQSPRRAKLPY
jgi:hypothetical protein